MASKFLCEIRVRVIKTLKEQNFKSVFHHCDKFPNINTIEYKTQLQKIDTHIKSWFDVLAHDFHSVKMQKVLVDNI